MTARIRGVLLLLAACSPPIAVDAGNPPPDSGADDSGTPSVDAGPPDAGPPDAGSARDAGVPDAGTVPDAGSEDAGLPPLLDVFGCDAGYASVGARFNGVAVYCQLNNDFGYYQCDELANRYMRDALQHPNLDNAAVDFASTICTRAVALGSAYSVRGPAFSSTAGHRPAPGDLIVWSGSPGHVALVTSASDTEVAFAQQNLPTLFGTAGWDPATSWFDGGATTLSFGSIRCWIHAEPAPPAAPPSGAPCGCFHGANDYCGLSIVNRSWWTGCSPGIALDAGNYDDLYSCDAGVFTYKQTCSGQCVSRSISNNTGFCR